ncbi:zinc ribbon domain-containing protein [uncultured Aliiroseovarius sp.]|uniref:zinc ribbon domain-containing protein n=2 Tax=Aliiroseovarius TaxID=1658781 RepID=UPI002594DF13|nr:zinc ribbon domain-containing protein [uncultured Aliiroseovarius sp.]
MPQCPHCMTDVHEDARVCPSCGAKKGLMGAGFTSRDLKARAAVVAGVGLLPLVVAIGFLINGDTMGFKIVGSLSLPPFGLAAWIFITSEGKEKWYR